MPCSEGPWGQGPGGKAPGARPWGRCPQGLVWSVVLLVGRVNRRHRYRQQALTFCDVLRLQLMTVPSLSLSRQFSMELHGRAIDECSDIEELRRVARTLLTAWQLQASMSEQYGAELLGLHRSAAGL